MLWSAPLWPGPKFCDFVKLLLLACLLPALTLAAMSGDATAIVLSAKLASVSTMLLLGLGTSVARWLALAAQYGGGCNRHATKGATSGCAGLLPLSAARARRAVGASNPNPSAGPAAFYFCWAGDGLGHLLHILCRATAATGFCRQRRITTEGSNHLTRLAVERLYHHCSAFGTEWVFHRCGPRLCTHGGRIRRGADDLRQCSVQNAAPVYGPLQPSRSAGIQQRSLAGCWHGGVFASATVTALRPCMEPPAMMSAPSLPKQACFAVQRIEVFL